jgi:hypothetical protein
MIALILRLLGFRRVYDTESTADYAVTLAGDVQQLRGNVIVTDCAVELRRI